MKEHPFNAEMQTFDRLAHNILCQLFSYRDIVKPGADGKPSLYLRRFYIAKFKRFRVFLHNIRRPDNDRHPHSHPWPFTSLCLKGGYLENIVDAISEHGVWTNKWRSFRPFQIISNPAIHTHMVEQIYGPSAWTLIKAGPAEREWDFLTEKGRIHYLTYLKENDVNFKQNAGNEYDEDIVET